MIEYYIIKFAINDVLYFCLWYDCERDSLFLTKDNKVKYFFNNNDLQFYCDANKMQLSNEEAVDFNIDILKGYLSQCKIPKNSFLLNFWNIFSDFANSIKQDFCGNDEQYTKVYSKIFYRNNLPTINTSGKIYIPRWDQNEVDAIATIMQCGINIVCKEFNIK